MRKGSNEKTFSIRKSPNILSKPGMQSFHIDYTSRISYNLNQAKRGKGKPKFWTLRNKLQMKKYPT